MTLLSFILILFVIAAVIYGITLAVAANWKGLLFLFVAVVAVIWVLGALGVNLPIIPTLK